LRFANGRFPRGGDFSLSTSQLIFRYAAFAVIATLANLGAQRLVLAWDSTAMGYAIAVICGTGIGLVVKFLLDRRWIFFEKNHELAQQSRQFTLYASTGILTTLLFWTSETLFWWIGGSDAARELGAIIGLAIGYVVKYRLDRRFVFTDQARPS